MFLGDGKMKKISISIMGLLTVSLLTGCGSKEAADSNTPASSSTTESQVSRSSQTSSTSSEAKETATTSASSTEAPSSSSSMLQQRATLNDTQKNVINQAFLDWAGERASIGNMAVSEWFFDHGAAGRGDWYAVTPDGQVQVQDNGVPGKSAFPIHAIGGCVFYTSKDGGIGKQELFADSFASNYSVKMDFTKPVSKYLLGDNGVVYELKTGNGEPVSTNTGFGEYADDGSLGSYTPSKPFEVSEDQAAHAKLQELLRTY